MLNILHIIIFFPGYLFLAFLFFFPTEWGKGRQVAQSGRQWRARKYFAPFHSFWIYFLLFFFRRDVVLFLVEKNILDNEKAAIILQYLAAY